MRNKEHTSRWQEVAAVVRDHQRSNLPLTPEVLRAELDMSYPTARRYVNTINDRSKSGEFLTAEGRYEVSGWYQLFKILVPSYSSHEALRQAQVMTQDVLAALRAQHHHEVLSVLLEYPNYTPALNEGMLNLIHTFIVETILDLETYADSFKFRSLAAQRRRVYFTKLQQYQLMASTYEPRT